MMQSPLHNRNTLITDVRDTFITDVLVCVAVTAVLYLRFFRLPMVPIDPAAGDQSMFLWGATQLLDGKVIYRDFFQFTTPGTEFVYAALIKFFGQSAVLAKMVGVLTGSAFFAVGLYISRKVVAGGIAYAPPLLFLTAGFLPEPDVTHHVFSSLAVLFGTALLLSDSESDSPGNWRWLAAGGCFAAASFFTTSRGLIVVALLVAMAFLQRRSRTAMMVVIGFTITFVCLMTPILWKAGWHNAFECLVTFPLQHYQSTPQTNFAAYASDMPLASSTHYQRWDIHRLLALIRWAIIYASVPAVYIFAAYRYRKLRSEMLPEMRNGVALLIITGFALFLSVAYSPNRFRMGMVSIPAIVLLFWLLVTAGKNSYRIVALALAIFAVVTVPAGMITAQSDPGTTINTPSGVICLAGAPDSTKIQKYLWFKTHVASGDYFYSPDHLEYAYLFRLQHPGPVPYLSIYDYTSPEQVDTTISALKNTRTKYVFWPVDVQKVTVNTEGAPLIGDHLEPLREYLRQNYRLVHTFNDFEEIWERK